MQQENNWTHYRCPVAPVLSARKIVSSRMHFEEHRSAADSSGLLVALSDPKSGTDPKVMRELATLFQRATDARMIENQRSPEGNPKTKGRAPPDRSPERLHWAGKDVKDLARRARAIFYHAKMLG
jgi:hypothetical protein